MSSCHKLFCAVLTAFGLMVGFGATSVSALEKDVKPAVKSTEKIDLNKATEEELQELPGVGDVTAKKIIAGRPFKSVDDLAKHGIRASTIDKIAPHVVQGRDASVAAKNDPKAAPTTPKKSDEKVDVNSADAADLEELPGVGEATAKKIIAGRPYKNEADLLKAGISQKTADKMAPMITFGKASAATTSKTDSKDDSKVSKSTTTGKDKKEPTDAKVPPTKGMVWVNTRSKIYHVEGDRWYGKTEKGEFMSEEDALKSGAKKAKGE